MGKPVYYKEVAQLLAPLSFLQRSRTVPRSSGEHTASIRGGGPLSVIARVTKFYPQTLPPQLLAHRAHMQTAAVLLRRRWHRVGTFAVVHLRRALNVPAWENRHGDSCARLVAG